MSMKPTNILQSLSSARWQTAQRTYGSSHATLIGLLVDWWVNSSNAHTALDGPPSHGTGNVGQGDALFCIDEVPAGILEVEGTRPNEKINSIASYFATTRIELQSISFGMLLMYSYAPTGSGENRQYPAAEDPAVINAALRVTQNHPTKSIIILTLDKQFTRFSTGARSLNEYYSGTTIRVTGMLLQNGSESRRIVYLGDEAS